MYKMRKRDEEEEREKRKEWGKEREHGEEVKAII